MENINIKIKNKSSIKDFFENKVKPKKKIAITFLITCLVIFGVILGYNILFTNYINLTQLKTNTNMQMMGYYIKTKNGKTIVIDGGNIGDAKNLEQYIEEGGGKVDYWFLTHFHTDHTGAISSIIENTKIDISNIVCKFCSKDLVEQYEPSRLEQYKVITNALANERVRDKIITPKVSDIFNIDGVKIKIISVYEDDIFNNLGNNTSMVFKLEVNNKSILFLGDTGVESSKKLLEYHLDDLKSDYVQMAHHGQNGATLELYKKIDPSYALWPTPDWLWDNNIGDGFDTGPYKTIETRNWMKSLNVKKSYIEKDGDITIKIF